MLIAILAVSLIAGGVGLWFGLSKFGGDKADETAAAEAGADKADGTDAAPGDAAEAAPAVPSGSALLTLDDMTLNIRGTNASGRDITRLMRVSLTIVYDAAYDGDNVPQVPSGDASGVPQAQPDGAMASKTPYLRDAFLEYLRQTTDRDLDGSLGMARMKAELLKRARAVVGGDAVREVLIGDLVIQ